MKKIITLFIAMVLLCITAAAQSDYLSFPDSVAENAFTDNDITFIEGKDFRAIIPNDALSEVYEESDYTLMESTPDENSVVIYTDQNGAKSTVALSFTNQYGFTTYVANKPGEYTLGTNHKDYTDTKGHWGEEYINFVSDRALFYGTYPTEFDPDETMTRGMFVTVLGRMHGVDLEKYDGKTDYSDVPSDMYYAPYIQWANSKNIMAGVGKNQFAPENPITRADMAVVINNYMKNSGFKFTVYKELDGFTDLEFIEQDIADAINTVKNVGIINGKGDGRFDPNGFSTRAEVAAIMQRVIKTVLGVNVPAGAFTNEYITRDRIRLGIWGFGNHLATEKGMKQLSELGVDFIVSSIATSSEPYRSTILSYADVYGIEVLIDGYYNLGATPESTDEFVATMDPVKFSASYMHHPSFAGHFILDKPGTDYFGAIASVVNDYEKRMPSKRAFVNLSPMYAGAEQLKQGANAADIEYYDSDPELYRKYCQAWFENFNSDYICTEIYPLDRSGTLNTTYDSYVESINRIATVARENDKEFWCCIQTYAQTDTKRTPNEAEFRWQSYCLLSFGATGIILRQYMSDDASHLSLIDNATLEPTQAYYDCMPVMKELSILSDTFIQYKNLGAFTINATKPYQKMTGEYTDFDTIKSIESEQALLIGCFEKKDGSGATAFTVVNMEELNDEGGAEVKISLDPSKKVTIYNRGKPTVATNDGVIELILSTGDGLFITVE